LPEETGLPHGQLDKEAIISSAEMKTLKSDYTPVGRPSKLLKKVVIVSNVVVRHPVACGVASLGIDHTNVLGNTVESIAWHKAGIFKVCDLLPAVSSNQPSSLVRVNSVSSSLPLSQILPALFHIFLPDCLHGRLPGPFLLSYSVFDFIFSLFFRFWAVR